MLKLFHAFACNPCWSARQRFLSTARLASRSLLRIQGDAVETFLQGLVTNDVTYISRPGSFMYTFLLNVKGRILTDAFIYHLQCHESRKSLYLLELDSTQSGEMIKYLAQYNLRKKVQIDHETDIAVWVAMPSHKNAPLTDSQSWLPIKSTSDTPLFERDLLFYAPDPRATAGWSGRVLLKKGVQADTLFMSPTVSPLDIDLYHRARWRLGLPEGSSELILGETLPLEANGDLSGAVSFSKGCYIGQELTTRTRFTGVVRRRYVPVRLVVSDSTVASKLPVGCHPVNAFIYRLSSVEHDLQNPKAKPVGWLRAFITENNPCSAMDGFALLRLTEISTSTPLVAVSLENSDKEMFRLLVTPYAPSWWSQEIAPDFERC
ncbi:Iron-sulfur clusters incorporation protein [Clonorchis sinensis]|uniref:Iron-sulfur clusters incorporation protein n=2 Tax=Clonorchis sinensis TaxID=79923 RepID=A0A8T1MTD1_CLOSI|nr:Iron-sulfur clusters incorporation protein [Clonorchis sinensis]